jgi:hypothetical protein
MLFGDKIMQNIGNFLNSWEAYDISDYIPFISTLNSITELFKKCVVIPFMNAEIINANHYYIYLKEKPVERCIMLLIPIIGNIMILLSDYINRNYCDKAAMLNIVQQDGVALRSAHYQIKTNEDVVLAAVQQNGRALEHAISFQNEKRIVLVAVQQNGLALQYASKKLQGEREVVLAAVRQNGLALQYADDFFKNDKEIGFSAIRQNGWALQYVSKELKDDVEAVFAALQQRESPWLIKFASERLRGDKNFMLSVVQFKGIALKFVTNDLQNDEEIVRAAIKENKVAIRYASDDLQLKLKTL